MLTSWNGFFLAGSRVLFALGRGRIAPPSLGAAHPRFGTPHVAVLVSGALTIPGLLLGRGAMVAFINVGSLCIAAAFVGVALSTLRLRRTQPNMRRPFRARGGPWVPLASAAGGVLIVSVLVVPGSPAALRWPLEWAILIGVLLCVAAGWIAGRHTRASVSRSDREQQVLDAYGDGGDDAP